METLVTKWKCIIELVNTNGSFEHHHNEPTCKDKWGFLCGKYKNIHDYVSSMSHNKEYSEIYAKDKNMQSFPKHFRKMYFEFIDSFMSNKPCFNPPNSQGYMNPSGHMCTMHDLTMILHHVMIVS